MADTRDLFEVTAWVPNRDNVKPHMTTFPTTEFFFSKPFRMRHLTRGYSHAFNSTQERTARLKCETGFRIATQKKVRTREIG